MKAIDRLLLYLGEQGIKPATFEKKVGLSNGYLATQQKRKGDLGETIILKIIDNCLGLSLVWLLTGKGEMFEKYNNDIYLPQNNIDDLITTNKDQAATIRRLTELIHRMEEQLSHKGK